MWEWGVSRGFFRKFILRVECFQEFLVKMLCLINIWIMEIFFAVASRTRTREGKKHVHKPRKLWYNGANRAQIRTTKGKP